jgi:hypothetical protein
MAIKRPNVRNTYVLNVHRVYKHFPFQVPPKFTQIGILGLKIYHLATLRETQKTAIAFEPSEIFLLRIERNRLEVNAFDQK